MRIEAELQRVLAELLRREVKDPRVGNVTLTAVSVAPDLSVAQVYFVPFGTAHSPEEVSAGLGHAAGFLRREIGQRLELRHAPRLEFRYDDSLQRAHDLTQLIDGAIRDDRSRHRDD
jgi:ribosome-binding factor A